MNAKTLRWLFVAVLGVGLSLAFLSAPVTLGASAQWSGDSYRFAGGTHPIALVFALAIVALYFALMFAPPSALGAPMPGVFRRFLTFWLDFVLAMMVMTPVIGILPTAMEWRRTGTFQWNFERTTHAPSDNWLVILATILISLGLVAYYSVPMVRRRPTPGSCVSGYQIVSDDGVAITPRKALLRTLLGFVALSVAYLAPFVARNRKKGKFWLDNVFGTHAVLLQ